MLWREVWSVLIEAMAIATFVRWPVQQEPKFAEPLPPLDLGRNPARPQGVSKIPRSARSSQISTRRLKESRFAEKAA